MSILQPTQLAILSKKKKASLIRQVSLKKL